MEHNNNNSDANEYFLDSGGSSNTQTPAHASLSSTFTPRQSWRASTNSRGRSGGGKAAAVDQNRGDNDVTRRLSWMPPNSYSSTTDNLNHNSNSSSLPLLRDLLQQKEIFAKSWSEPDRREIRRRRRDGDDFVYDNYYHVNTTTRRQRGLGGGDYNEQYRMSPTDVEMAATVSTITKCDTINDNSNQQQQQLSMLLTPIEIEYNTLLQQTESLLLSLSSESSSSASTSAHDHNNNSSQSSIATTLQQMDFDNVMMKWSRLHTISDDSNEKKAMMDKENITSSSRMKCNAYDQCLRLLHALENNYDCILDSCLLSLSSSTTSSSATNKNNNHHYPRHRHIMPNATSYNLTLHTMANINSNNNNGPTTTNDVSYEAYNILLRMINRCKRYIDTIDSLFLNNNSSSSNNGYENNENTTSSSIVTRVQTAIAKGLLPTPPCEPTIITMNSVIHAIARSNTTSDAGHLVEEVYRVMDQWSMECQERQRQQQMSFVDSGHNIQYNNNNRVWLYQGVTPNARTLACTIDAWANSNTNIKTTTSTIYQQDSSSSSSTSCYNFAPERADAILQLAINQRRAYVNNEMMMTTRMKQKQVTIANR